MKVFIYSIMAAAPVLLGYACTNTGTEAHAAAKKTEQHISLYTLKSGGTAEGIRLPAALQAYQFVQIFPRVSGFISTISVDRGSVVRKGQVLMQLDAPELEQNMSAAKLKYIQAEANVQASRDRYMRLVQTSKTPGTVSAGDLAAARAKMMADSALVQGELSSYMAQKDLYGYLTVSAPFDGIITERNVHPGALVGPGTMAAGKPMLVLEQQNRLRLVAAIPEEYSARIQDGDPVQFTVNALPGKTFSGTIARASGSLNEHYRSETVEVDVENNGGVFKPGMYAEIMIPAKGMQNGYAVPKTAVVTTTEKKYVLADVNGSATPVDVSVGNESADSAEIFGNVHDGQNIVAHANEDIKAGTPLGR